MCHLCAAYYFNEQYPEHRQYHGTDHFLAVVGHHACTDVVSRYGTPVSYTHLDVYKRQILFSLALVIVSTVWAVIPKGSQTATPTVFDPLGITAQTVETITRRCV